MLALEGIDASYGPSQVLFGVTLQVGAGEAVTLLGRNGMGKSTTLRTMMGLMRPSAGRISFKGEDITPAPSHRIAAAGIGYVPEGRRIFPNLTVRENLLVTERSRGRTNGWSLPRVLEFFPRLGERLDNMGTRLSGGEQQMLAIGRALMTNPDLLVLDEATEGLAPVIREEIWERLALLKREGMSLLVVDKELDALQSLADRHYVLEKGEVVWTGAATDLQANRDMLDRMLSA